MDQAETSLSHAHRSPVRAAEVALIILAFLAVIYTLYFAAGIILPFVLAVVLGLLLSPFARFLHHRLRLPRMLAAAVLIAILFCSIGGVFVAVQGAAAGWFAKAPSSLPMLQQKLGMLRRPIEMFEAGLTQMQSLMASSGTHQSAGNLSAPSPAPPAGAPFTLSQAAESGLSLLNGTRSLLGEVLTLVIILFFLLADGDSLLRRFVEILPGFDEKRRAVQIATQIERNISGYLATITVMNLAVGIANGVSIWAFGLPDPLLWGTAAFLLNYIPILGALAGMTIFFFVGLFSFASVGWAFAPSCVYLLIHILEGETITPMLLARRFTLNPLLVIAALMFWDWLWGVTGALLAVPLLAVTKIFCDHIEVLAPLGHLLGAEPNKRKEK